MPFCKLADCTVARDGRCLEGRGNDCPNILADQSSTPSEVITEGDKLGGAPYPPSETLYSGLPLDIVEAREFSRRSRAIVVSLAGMSESGKTSLLARLHQQFQAGPIGNYDFAGSRTLLRFEELNWLATMESGVARPDMEHSSRQYDNSLLHFTVKDRVNGSGPVDVLLNDISGETFPEVITTQSVSEQLMCLRRADHLALVVDGAAIADSVLRHDHCAKAKNFVQRLLQTGQIGKHTGLHLVITKQDVLLREGRAAENIEVATRLEREFRSLFSSRVGELQAWRIAARPLDGSMPTTEVISKLFATWVGSSYRYLHSGTDRAAIKTGRDFCRFESS